MQQGRFPNLVILHIELTKTPKLGKENPVLRSSALVFSRLCSELCSWDNNEKQNWRQGGKGGSVLRHDNSLTSDK